MRMKPGLLAAAWFAGLCGGAAAAQPAAVGTLCNADGLVEVFTHVSTTACAADPEKEMKALFKAQTQYQRMKGLSVEQKLQIDGRIERRIRELRKLKAAKKEA